MISKCADVVNFVLSTFERIPMTVETSERFLSVDGIGKRVVQIHGELNVLVSAIEIRTKLNSGVLIVK